jgi:hypothetical protein
MDQGILYGLIALFVIAACAYLYQQFKAGNVAGTYTVFVKNAEGVLEKAPLTGVIEIKAVTDAAGAVV